MPDTSELGGQAERAIDSVAERLGGELPNLIAEYDIPGMAVGVCHRSGASWSAGFGVKARGSAEPVSAQTIFGLQSVSKMYTATVVMLAIQHDLLDLDAPVTTYLPEFTVKSRWEAAPEQRITLRHLLSHTAGLTHEAPLGSNIDSRDSSFEEHCRSISDTWLRFPIGHHYEYSNLGVDLAAYVIQRVSGMDFCEYARHTLLEPLGLHRTTFDQHAITRDQNRAVGHSAMADQLPMRVPMVGAGGAYTSVDDTIRYLMFHLSDNEDLLRKELLHTMYRIPSPLPGQRYGYGLGVAISRWNGRRILNHGGGGFGFLSELAWDPVAGFGVAVLTNSEDHPLQVHLATSILRDLTGCDFSTPSFSPAEVFDTGTQTSMAGQYVGRGGDIIRITFDKTRLSLERWGRIHELRIIGSNEAVAADDSHQRYRLLAPDREPGQSYLVSVDNGDTYYRNDPPTLTDDAPIQTYLVDYLGKAVATLRVRRQGDHATLEGEGLLAFPPLQLTKHATGLYFCTMGEALDLTTDPPTYANIPLQPQAS